MIELQSTFISGFAAFRFANEFFTHIIYIYIYIFSNVLLIWALNINVMDTTYLFYFNIMNVSKEKFIYVVFNNFVRQSFDIHWCDDETAIPIGRNLVHSFIDNIFTNSKAFFTSSHACTFISVEHFEFDI